MIEATIARDAEGFPSLVTLQDGAKRLEVAFDRDIGFTITGSRRSFTQELLDMLRMIYPATVDFKFNIPQPLQVETKQSSKTILFDDMEGLLKWGGVNVALDNTMAYNDSQSLRIFNEAASNNRYAVREFPLTSNKKVEYSFFWGIDDFSRLDLFEVYFRTYNGVQQVYHALRLDWDNRYWYDVNNAQVICNTNTMQNLDGVEGTWHYLKVTLDLQNNAFAEFQINDRVFKLNIPLLVAASAENIRSEISIYLNNKGAVDVYAWIDDFLMREVT